MISCFILFNNIVLHPNENLELYIFGFHKLNPLQAIDGHIRSIF